MFVICNFQLLSLFDHIGLEHLNDFEKIRNQWTLNWEICYFCQFYDSFSKSISAQLSDQNILFCSDCKFNYYTVALYAVWRNLLKCKFLLFCTCVWRNLDQNWHFRGDLNIEFCLNLRHKKLISQSCRSDMWSNVSHFMFFR